MKYSVIVLLFVVVVSALVVTFFLKRENFYPLVKSDNASCPVTFFDKTFRDGIIRSDLPLNLVSSPPLNLVYDTCIDNEQKLCNTITGLAPRPESSNTPQNFKEF